MAWDTNFLGDSLASLLVALAVIAGINVAFVLGKRVLVSRLKQLAGRTAVSLDDGVLAVLAHTRSGLVFLFSLAVGARHLELPAATTQTLGSIATIAAFLQLGLWANAAFRFWMERYKQRAVAADVSAATSLGALMFIGQVFVWSIVLLVALDNLGVDVTGLIAGLGIGGIAVALAVQNILGDLFASLSIVIDKPFVVGDFIIVEEYVGTVEYVGLKTTRLRSLGGEQIIFSNSDLLGARVRNYKRMYERRIVFSFGVLYQTTPEQLEKVPRIVRAIIEGHDVTRFDRAHFAKFGDSSLDFEVVYWMKDPDYNRYMDVQQGINLSLMRAFESEGIGFAYPTRTLFVEGPVKLERQAARANSGGSASAKSCTSARSVVG